MRDAVLLPRAFPGLPSDRAEDPEREHELQTARRLVAPLWSAAFARRRAQRCARDVARQLAQASPDAESLRTRVLPLRRALSCQGWTDALLDEALLLAALAARLALGITPRPTQLLAARLMLQGRLAEMATGEGKTLAIALTAAAAALGHARTHVVTANDYLVMRDAETMGPLFAALGLRVTAVTPALGDPRARAAWRSDVVYCSGKTVVFDHLRDRVTLGDRRGPLQRQIDRLSGRDRTLLPELAFGLVDEADSVLIDECRTPLILSRPTPAIHGEATLRAVLVLARTLEAGEHFEQPPGSLRAKLTEAGRRAVAAHTAAARDLPATARLRESLVEQTLAALHAFRRDEHYLVKNGSVQIIDSATGRVLPDRAWEQGLHQLIELKEGCPLTAGRETLARLTYPRFFAGYARLAATTGTARELAGELWRVHGLRVVAVQRFRAGALRDLGLRLCADAAAQQRQVAERVTELVAAGRPVLIATRTLAASEALSAELTAHGIAHEVLNAAQDAREAQIVARAGEAGQVTVATNMAGRGTDIPLGEGVAQRGGLHVIATELNESRRIDRQLAGRAGRQGDPGSHECVLALDDALFVATAPGWLRALVASRVQRNAEGGWQARVAISLAQWRLELRAARERRLALREDRRLARVLAFAGCTE